MPVSGDLNQRSQRLRAKISREAPPAGVVFHPCAAAKFVFLPVSRAGSTSVKTVILQQMGTLPGGIHAVHDALGYQPNQTTCLSPSEGQQLAREGYTSFAVYRDPVDRFRSVRRWFPGHALTRRRWRGLADEAGPYDYDFLVDLARAELSFEQAEEMDEHLRPQALYHRLAGPLDWIVPLQHLGAFMHSVIGVEVPHRHTTMRVDDAGPLPPQEAEIRRLYADDLQIPLRFADRLYQP